MYGAKIYIFNVQGDGWKYTDGRLIERELGICYFVGCFCFEKRNIDIKGKSQDIFRLSRSFNKLVFRKVVVLGYRWGLRVVIFVGDIISQNVVLVFL